MKKKRKTASRASEAPVGGFVYRSISVKKNEREGKGLRQMGGFTPRRANWGGGGVFARVEGEQCIGDQKEKE